MAAFASGCSLGATAEFVNVSFANKLHSPACLSACALTPSGRPAGGDRDLFFFSVPHVPPLRVPCQPIVHNLHNYQRSHWSCWRIVLKFDVLACNPVFTACLACIWTFSSCKSTRQGCSCFPAKDVMCLTTHSRAWLTGCFNSSGQVHNVVTNHITACFTCARMQPPT